jgi:hypothetical protein
MRSEGTDSAAAESTTGHKEDDRGLLDKAKDELTGSAEEKAPKESGTQQHQSEDAPPPGEEPTTPGYDSPKSGPA